MLEKIVIVTLYLTMGWENECVLYYCELRRFFFMKRIALLPFPCWAVCCQLQNIAPLVTFFFF